MRSIVDLCGDPAVFGPWLKDPFTWRAWETFLCALFGLPMDAEQREAYRACTGRTERQSNGYNEAWLVVGRRGGKSFVLALIAVFLAAFMDWRPYLAPGERGTVMIIAADRKQARVILRYIKSLLQGVPMLRQLIERETAESIDLRNGITIEIHTCRFRAVRGYTVVAALLDEVAFWRSDDSANPDTEILTALRPAMVTVPGAMLLAASSPYARRGVLYEAWRDHYGQDDGQMLVWQADTRTMNPTVYPAPKTTMRNAGARAS